MTGQLSKLKLPLLVRPGHTFPEPKIPERMIWTSSSVRLFRACKRKWFWKYIMGIRPKFRDKNLIIGSMAHECWGQWYRGQRSRIAPIAEAIAARTRKEVEVNAPLYDQEDYDKLTIALDTFVGMMMGYELIYEQDRATWKIDRPSIEAVFKLDMGDFDYAGRIDLTATGRKSYGHFLAEHKTASKIEESYLARLPLDTQIRGYTLGATAPTSIGGLGLDLDHVLYDVVRKCKLRRKSNEKVSEFSQRIAEEYASDPGKCFYREPLRFNKSDLDTLVYELHQNHQEYLNLLKDHDVLKATIGFNDPRAWQPNDKHCDAYFRTCEYHQLCTVGLDRGTSTNYQYEPDLNEELADND